MKRIAILIHSILMMVLAMGMALTAQAAETAVDKAQKELDAALAEQEAAGKAYNAAKAAYEARKKDGYDKGAPGFFQWIINTRSGGETQWMADDASQALELYEKSAFRNYTRVGDEEDASDLENMRNSLDLFPVLIMLRSNDEYRNNLPPVYTNSLIMARGQINANASSFTGHHMGRDSGYSTAAYSENLAWGYPITDITDTHSAFAGWYYAEKQSYKKLYDYVSSHFSNGIRYDTEEFANYVYRPDTDGTKAPILNAWNQFSDSAGVIGHYTNTLSGVIQRITDEDTIVVDGVSYGTIRFRTASRVIAGFGISGYSDCTSLEMNALHAEKETHLYTPEAYIGLFRQYYNMVSPEKERKLLKAAEARYEAAKGRVSDCEGELEWLKSISRTISKKPSSIKTKVKKNKVTVTWKKFRVTKKTKADWGRIKKIEIQYSTDRSFPAGNRKSKLIGKKKTKQVLKGLQKGTTYYIRVRYTDGAGGYSNWSSMKKAKTKK